MSKEKLTLLYAMHQAFHWFIVGLTIPVIILLYQSRGLTLSEIGIVMTVWVGCSALLEVPLGGVADQYGRKRVYQVSLVITILGSVVTLYANSFISLMLAAALLGSARAVYSGTLDAWFYDEFHKLKGNLTYHQASAKINVLLTLGIGTGCFWGGQLPSVYQAWSTTKSAPFNGNVIMTILLSLVLLVLTQVAIHESDVKADSIADKGSSHQTGVIKHCIITLQASLNHDTLRPLLLAGFVYGLVLSTVETLWQPQLMLLQVNTEIARFGVISSLYFAMAALASFSSVKAVAWFRGSHRYLLFSSRALAGAVLLLLSQARSPEAFTLLYLLFFFLFTLGYNSERILINHAVESKQRSTLLSLYSFTISSGAIFSAGLLSYIADIYSISTSWVIAATVLFISCFWYLKMPQSSTSTEEKLLS